MSKLLETMSDVAFALGVSKQTVSDWKAMGCPHLKKKPFDVAKIDKWQKDNIDPSKVRRKRTEGSLELIDRRKLAETEIKELTAANMKWEREVREGRLVYAEDWDKALGTQAEAFRRELLGIEHQSAPKIIGITTREEAARVLHEVAVDILKRLHLGGP